jgi:predicted ATPase
VSLSIGNRLISLVGDHSVLNGLADDLINVAAEQSFPFWRAQGTIYRGYSRVKSGDVPEGLSLLRSGSSAYRATGAELWMPYYITLLATACEIAEQTEEALILLDDALKVVGRTGERWLEAELHRHKGQLLLRQGNFDAADDLYRKARSIAEEQMARFWELRAATSLARLWADSGRSREARELLAPVYEWFTEGFDTPDLKAATALLDALG